MFGSLFILKDSDSTADNQNNEVNVQNDQVSGGGPKDNEDEDDHDIEAITLGTPVSGCPTILSFANTITHLADEVFNVSEKLTLRLQFLLPLWLLIMRRILYVWRMVFLLIQLIWVVAFLLLKLKIAIEFGVFIAI